MLKFNPLTQIFSFQPKSQPSLRKLCVKGFAGTRIDKLFIQRLVSFSKTKTVRTVSTWKRSQKNEKEIGEKSFNNPVFDANFHFTPAFKDFFFLTTLRHSRRLEKLQRVTPPSLSLWQIEGNATCSLSSTKFGAAKLRKKTIGKTKTDETRTWLQWRRRKR